MKKLVNSETNYDLLQGKIEECLANEQTIILNIHFEDGTFRYCLIPEEFHFTYEKLVIEDEHYLMINFYNCQSIEYDEYEESFCLKYPSIKVYIEFLE